MITGCLQEKKQYFFMLSLYIKVDGKEKPNGFPRTAGSGSRRRKAKKKPLTKSGWNTSKSGRKRSVGKPRNAPEN